MEELLSRPLVRLTEDSKMLTGRGGDFFITLLL